MKRWFWSVSKEIRTSYSLLWLGFPLIVYLYTLRAFRERWKSAAKWLLSKALIFAIMHTESVFNPLARSHILAFGFMQIVPESAGRDASGLRKRTFINRPWLVWAQKNIEMGAAFLPILDCQYLKSITDVHSQQLCIITVIVMWLKM